MSPTPVQEPLIHRPSDVKSNAERFDHLCRLAEEVSFPIVQTALFREYYETVTTGAEILSDEAKRALEILAEDAAILEELDQKEVLQNFQTSLSKALPPPDVEESRQHASELAQMLMSAWLEILRSTQATTPVLLLSDLLLPESPARGIAWFKERIGGTKPKIPQTLMDTIAWSAVNEDDAIAILTTLRVKLFPEPRIVDLPFNLAMIGAPWKPVLASTRSYFDNMSLTPIERPEKTIFETPGRGSVAVGFATAVAQKAEAYLSERLAKTQYGSMAIEASTSLETKSVATQVQQAISTD